MRFGMYWPAWGRPLPPREGRMGPNNNVIEARWGEKRSAASVAINICAAALRDRCSTAPILRAHLSTQHLGTAPPPVSPPLPAGSVNPQELRLWSRRSAAGSGIAVKPAFGSIGLPVIRPKFDQNP